MWGEGWGHGWWKGDWKQTVVWHIEDPSIVLLPSWCVALLNTTTRTPDSVRTLTGHRAPWILVPKQAAFKRLPKTPLFSSCRYVHYNHTWLLPCRRWCVRGYTMDDWTHVLITHQFHNNSLKTFMLKNHFSTMTENTNLVFEVFRKTKCKFKMKQKGNINWYLKI